MHQRKLLRHREDVKQASKLIEFVCMQASDLRYRTPLASEYSSASDFAGCRMASSLNCIAPGGLMSSAGSSVAGSSKWLTIGWLVGLLGAIGFVVYGEWMRLGEGHEWLFDINIDSSPYVLWLIALPMCWWIRQPIISLRSGFFRTVKAWLAESAATAQGPAGTLRAAVLVSIVGCVAFACCSRVGNLRFTEDGPPVGQLPPAFHDEFSYQFQAETFRAGRWSFDSHPTAARMFDQMHVLNEGHFASRYFPGTGVWMAPFVARGNPYLGHWLATAFAAMLIALAGRELSCNGVGLLAGLLTALSPGIDLFGNLLLAHQPTLVGLSLFLWTCLRLLRLLESDEEATTRPRSTLWWSLLAGTGLAFGMLCRPMTAAGIGLPFGIVLGIWLWRRGRQKQRAAVAVVGGFAVPLILAFAILGWQNILITGRLTKSPYSLYTELFTPRHQYGFNNVTRAEQHLTDRVLDHYDRWAENLTPKLAAWNVGVRLLASWLWTLGPVAITLGLGAFLGGQLHDRERRWWLIPAAIISLHAVHVPYWFSGIMHWHYVFESGPLWCLIVAQGASSMLPYFEERNRPLMSSWLMALLAMSVVVNQVALAPIWSMSRVEAGMHELAFSRFKLFEFRETIAAIPHDQPAIVFVRHDSADRHIDYVSNHPSLQRPLLIARLPADAKTSEEDTLKIASQAFPERRFYVFDAKSRRLTALQ